jgi:hypothetical protein
MEEFNGMHRNNIKSKIPTGMWEFARNILMTKGWKSIMDEDGFDLKVTIPGQIIGRIDTNEEVICFSVDGIYSCIGIYTEISGIGQYIPKIRSLYLGFKVDRPIEGVFFYNFKKELIVAFCDGVFADSNVPRLINLTNFPVPLTGLELTNPTDVVKLNLFLDALDADIDVKYINNGTLEADVIYISYSYVSNDSLTSTVFFPIHVATYPTYNFRELNKRNIEVFLTNLDARYSKLRLGLLVVKDSGLFGYQSEVLTYSGTSYNTIISSLTNYTTIATDELVVPKAIYSRVETMTFNNSELLIGHLVGTEAFKFQKYANQLELELTYDIKKASDFTTPMLCPDEVYSITICPQFLNGTYGEEYHIPGVKPYGDNLNVLSSTDIDNLGLNSLNPEVFKKFRIFNTGGFVNNTIPISIPYNPAEFLLRWGYWENQETYPNDNEYNSGVDYDGSTIVGGEDLRSTNIRYHRVPGLNALVTKFPCILGYDNKNEENPFGDPLSKFRGLIPAFGINVTNFNTVVPPAILNQIQGYKLSIVKRKAGDYLVEDINFIKQALAYNASGVTNIDTGVSTVFESTMYTKMPSLAPSTPPYNLYACQFGFSKVRSNTLFSYTPKITPRIIKANYALRDAYGPVSGVVSAENLDYTKEATRGTVGGVSEVSATAIPSFYLVPDAQRFAVVNDIKYVPENNQAAFTLYTETGINLFCHNTLEPLIGTHKYQNNRWNPLGIVGFYDGTDDSGIPGNVSIDAYDSTLKKYDSINISGFKVFSIGLNTTLLNLPINVYAGFNPKDFIVLGKKTINNPNPFINCGDIFTNNLYNVVTTVIIGFQVGNYNFARVKFFKLGIKGGFSVCANSEIYLDKGQKQLANTYEYLDSPPNDIDLLNTFDYKLEVFNKETLRSLNDIFVGVSFSITNIFVSYFPYRIHRSLVVADENLTTTGIRTFLANSYKEMLNDRGAITALRGTNKILFIQQKYSLFLASIKDKLTHDNTETYLGVGDLFDRQPDEIFYNSNKGYIGCTSKFASIVFKGGYVVGDQVKGKIFIISEGGSEISEEDMSIWFTENWSTAELGIYTLDRFGNQQNVDNPFTQIGHIIGYDEKYHRLLFTKKAYIIDIDAVENSAPETGAIGVFMDGVRDANTLELIPFTNTDYYKEISKTISYDLDKKKWICEHDYFPSTYFNTNKNLYNAVNTNSDALLYQQNSLTTKRLFHFGIKAKSYIDLIFNNRIDISKLYQNVTWNTIVTDKNGENYYFKTIDALMLYTDFQCTGELSIPSNTIKISRNNEGNWDFNGFRDFVVNSNLPIVNNVGSINVSNININKSWFDKSNFIHTFIVVRMIINNDTNNTTYINVVNVKSRNSDRT